jgi:hypothetical protein
LNFIDPKELIKKFKSTNEKWKWKNINLYINVIS